MRVEILTPETTVFTEENAAVVQLPAIDGYFEILNNHAPMITVLGTGNAKIIDNNNETHHFDIAGGVVEVLTNKVLVLAEKCTQK
ncbi:MAG: F0F1 ATP synthase subunit epsilon [Bacteroidetes bacterium]|nr:F0F1 ATP synthase subunit epsilon [Bacteroidota bacterium]